MIESNQYQCMDCGEDTGTTRGFRKDDKHCDSCGSFYVIPYSRGECLKEKQGKSVVVTAIPVSHS